MVYHANIDMTTLRSKSIFQWTNALAATATFAASNRAVAGLRHKLMPLCIRNTLPLRFDTPGS